MPMPPSTGMTAPVVYPASSLAKIGVAAGLLSAAGDVPVPLAVLAGGAATGSATGLFLALVRYASADRT
jgi:hypothetical protein